MRVSGVRKGCILLTGGFLVALLSPHAFAGGAPALASPVQVVTLPDLPAPAVPSPPAVPSLPAVPAAPSLPSAPAPAAPVAPEVRLPPVTAAPAPASAPGARPASPASPASSAARPATSGGGPAASTATGRRGRTSARQPAGASRRRSGTAAQRRVVRRDRRLRRTVEALQECLGSLPRAERRVLVLRAAVRRPQTRSRRHVARLLDRPLRQVTRLERSGLRRLRALNRGSGCGRSSAEAEAASVTANYHTTVGGSDPTAVSVSGGTGKTGELQVLDESASGGPDQTSRAKPDEPRAAARPPLSGVANAQPGGLAPQLLIGWAAFFIASAVLAVFVALVIRDAVLKQRRP